MKRIYMLPILLALLLTVTQSEPRQNSQQVIDNNYLEKIRLTYYAGVEEEEYADSLNILLNEKFGEDTSSYPTLALAYKAGLKALKSKHAFWPFTKMSYLNESMDIFGDAVKEDPDNLEIRFMRFSILYYVPGILGYDEEEQRDLQKVYELLMQRDFSLVNNELQEGMAEFLIDSELLSGEQERALNRRFTIAKNE